MISEPISVYENRQLVLMSHSYHHVEKFLPIHNQPVLMRIEVGRAKTHRKCTFNLGAQFDFDLLRFDVLVIFPVMMEVSVFVQETRHFVGGSYRTPTVINSLTRHSEMQSEVSAGMGFGVASDLGEPRA